MPALDSNFAMRRSSDCQTFSIIPSFEHLVQPLKNVRSKQASSGPDRERAYHLDIVLYFGESWFYCLFSLSQVVEELFCTCSGLLPTTRLRHALLHPWLAFASIHSFCSDVRIQP